MVLLFKKENGTGVSNECELTNKIKLWLDGNQLFVNISKTKFKCFGLYQPHLPLDCACKTVGYRCNHYVLRNDKIKYLGITMDENINWNRHVNYINSKI